MIEEELDILNINSNIRVEETIRKMKNLKKILKYRSDTLYFNLGNLLNIYNKIFTSS